MNDLSLLQSARQRYKDVPEVRKEATVNAAAELTFTPFPKIGRLEKDMVVTEKLDGTNAAVVVTEDGLVYAQSRSRIITPASDNYGFAAWVADHEDDLRYGLGEGIHFGEWWGSGIQRGYDLPKGEKRFSLFNTGRWHCDANEEMEMSYDYRCHECPACYVVPVLAISTFSTPLIYRVYDHLKLRGSFASPGFKNPEGVVVYHTAQGHLFKLSDAKVQPREFGG